MAVALGGNDVPLWAAEGIAATQLDLDESDEDAAPRPVSPLSASRPRPVASERCCRTRPLPRDFRRWGLPNAKSFASFVCLFVCL